MLGGEELSSLIPDVLDTLLDFHLNIVSSRQCTQGPGDSIVLFKLRRLGRRMSEKLITDSIADIICEEVCATGHQSYP